MLSQEVIDAVKNEKFTLYTAKSVDEAMGLLTGQDMGEKSPDGNFPIDTINHKIINQLRHFAKLTEKRD